MFANVALTCIYLSPLNRQGEAGSPGVPGSLGVVGPSGVKVLDTLSHLSPSTSALHLHLKRNIRAPVFLMSLSPMYRERRVQKELQEAEETEGRM